MIDLDEWLRRSMPRPGWLVPALRLAALGALVFSVVGASPGPGWSGRGAWILVCLILASAAWIGWTARGSRPVAQVGAWLPVLVIVGVLSLAGGFLVGLSPSRYVEAFPCIAVFSASVQLPLRWSVLSLVVAVAAITAGSLPGAIPSGGLVQATLIPVGVLLAGLNRRQRLLRTEEEARSAALAERARIAREVHDVLAHSLAGLTIQLEAGRALLADGADLARALAHVERAHHLGVEGLAETRRAVAALRDGTPPLAELLGSLVDGHGLDTGLEVRGRSRPLSPDAALTVYRVAQEALTNVSRHAPGARVHVELEYEEHETVLIVSDQRPSGAEPSPNHGGGTGSYGLLGMRERAELAGGILRAGPWGNGWRVELRVPV